VRPYSTRESAGLFVLQVIVAPTPDMFDDAIDVMMSSGEPLFRPCRVKQADPVVMTAHPHIKAKR
jgi:hypothetical protein